MSFLVSTLDSLTGLGVHQSDTGATGVKSDWLTDLLGSFNNNHSWDHYFSSSWFSFKLFSLFGLSSSTLVFSTFNLVVDTFLRYWSDLWPSLMFLKSRYVRNVILSFIGSSDTQKRLCVCTNLCTWLLKLYVTFIHF